ncbi:MAG: PepSY domain-containing protein [Defluviitaleaceae bacterium]|nr:PepSY domain-containing protein [Defluviitaleaceae bacterium]
MNKIYKSRRRGMMLVSAFTLAAVIAIILYLPGATAYATTVNIDQTEQMTAQEMQAAIMELRALIEALVILQSQQPVAPAPVQPVAPPPQPATQQQSHNRGIRPINPAITREQAILIAQAELATHGLVGTLRSASLDWERGQWVWEVDLRTNSNNRWQREFEVYINVDTGFIVHTEFDD